MTEDKKNFKIFVPVRVAKSLKPLPNGDIDFEVEGDLHADQEDFQGDKFPVDIVDTSNLDKFGRMKYEHDNPSLPTPANNIGFVTETEHKKKSVGFKGRVFAKKDDSQNYKLAKELMDDMNNLEEWNKKYKSMQKSYGISLQGPMFVDKSTKKPKKIVVESIVFTTGPVNQGSFARAIQKSLNASYEVNPEDMKGADALKKESINHKKKGRKMKFTNKKEAVDYYVAKGNTEEEAESKATAALSKQENIQKSLKAGLKIITDTLNSLEEEGDDLEAAEKRVNKISKSLNAALETDNDKVDAEEFLKQQGASLVNTGKEVINIKKSMNGQTAAILTGMKHLFEVIDDQNQGFDDVMEMVDNTNAEVALLTKSLKKVTGGLSTSASDGAGSGDGSNNDQATLTDVQKVDKISKSLSARKIEDALVITAVNPAQVNTILGEGITPEIITTEVGMARINGYAYKSLSANCKRIVDVKLKDEIDAILAAKPAEA